MHHYNIVRAGLGVLIVTGAVVGLYNMVRSIFFNSGETA
jgi:hypothetical protein